MGKYQLDDKGKAQVRRFHEKQARKRDGKKQGRADLQAQFLAKVRRSNATTTTD